MEFHVCREDGQSLGVFTLEILQSRRASGLLNGSELVWREGMADWQRLDAVLGVSPNQANPRSNASLKPRFSTHVPVIAIAGVIMLVVVLAMLWLMLGRTPKTTKFMPAKEAISLAELDNASGEDRLALELAGRPIVWNEKTRTAKDWSLQRRAFLQRQYLDSYQKNGIRNPETDADAILLIESWMNDVFREDKLMARSTATAGLAKKLSSNPDCKDPVVLLIASICIPELKASVEVLERSVRAFEKSSHTPYARCFALIRLAEGLYKDKSDRVPVLDASAVQSFREMLAGVTLISGDDELLAQSLLEGDLGSFFSRNSDRLVQISRSSGDRWKWLGLILEGDQAINEAWRSRGGAVASAVSEEGWKGFRRHLGRAKMFLEAAWKQHPERPLAPALMIRVAMGGSGVEEMRLWFDRAVVAQIDHPTAWNQFKSGLYPRWHGSLQAMLALGKMAVDTKRFDTDVPRHLLGVIGQVEKELKLPPTQRIFGRGDVWPSVREMFEGYISQATTETSRQWWRTYFSIAAYQAKEYSTARDQLAACDWKPDPNALQGWKTDLSLMDLEVAARTGPLGAKIAEAESTLSRGNLDGALKIFSRLKSDSSADPRTRAFVEDRLVTLGLTKRLQSGKWVDLLPSDNDLRGWNVQRGEFTRKPDGAIEVKSGHLGHAMYSRVPMGLDFEVRGEIETVRSSTDAFQGGLVIGLPHLSQTGWNAFRLRRNQVEGDVVSYSRGWTKAQIYKSYVLNDHTNKFEFRFRTNLVSVGLNGTTLVSDATPIENRDLLTHEIYLGIGAFNEMNETVMRYRRLEVRLVDK